MRHKNFICSAMRGFEANRPVHRLEPASRHPSDCNVDQAVYLIMILSIKKFDHVTEISGADAILYDIGTDVAYFRDGQATGPSLVWTWSDEAVEGALLSHSLALSGDTPWIVRCDRVDFPPGSVAYRHIHPGPGIRCTLFGGLTIDADGHKQRYGAFKPWFEVGPDPVEATADSNGPSAFARVMFLPARWEGKRTIQYVNPADDDRPKLQKPTVFFDQVIN